MLKVRTRIATSPIHGIGLFAAEPIAPDTLIWQFDPPFDLTFTTEMLAVLSAPARELVEKYAYFERQLGAYVLCGDDARFMNHSPTPNTAEVIGMRTVTACAIAEGEEIVCDYTHLGLGSFRASQHRSFRAESKSKLRSPVLALLESWTMTRRR